MASADAIGIWSLAPWSCFPCPKWHCNATRIIHLHLQGNLPVMGSECQDWVPLQ